MAFYGQSRDRKVTLTRDGGLINKQDNLAKLRQEREAREAARRQKGAATAIQAAVRAFLEKRHQGATFRQEFDAVGSRLPVSCLISLLGFFHTPIWMPLLGPADHKRFIRLLQFVAESEAQPEVSQRYSAMLCSTNPEDQHLFFVQVACFLASPFEAHRTKITLKRVVTSSPG